VLLADDGPRVIDFGIVRAGGDSPGPTRNHTRLATPPAPAPTPGRPDGAAQRKAGQAVVAALAVLLRRP
jgi:hypothetical protein